MTDARGGRAAGVAANASGASTLVVRPRPHRARGILVRRPRTVVATLLVALAAVIGGGYAIGRTGAADLSAAQRAGAEEGRAAGSHAGADRGFHRGYADGRKSSYRRAYRRAYRKAMRDGER